MKKTKLSIAQLDVLQKLASCEEPLAYSMGGYWSNQNQAAYAQRYDCAPIWHTTKGTVDALERMGLLKQTGTSTNYPIGAYPALSDRALSAKGLALATGTNEPMDGLVDAVTAWFGGKPLHFSGFTVLRPKEWTKLLHDQLPPSTRRRPRPREVLDQHGRAHHPRP